MLSRSLSFSDPLMDRHRMLVALEHLAGRLAQELDRSGHHAMALSPTVSTADSQGAVHGYEQAAGTPVKPPSCDAQLLRRTAGRLLGKLNLLSGVTGLTLLAYPLREWHVSTRQIGVV